MDTIHGYGGARVQVSLSELHRKLATNERRAELIGQLEELVDFIQSEILPIGSLWVYGSILDVETCDDPSDIDVCAFCLKADYDTADRDPKKRVLLSGLESQMHRHLFGYEIDFMLISEPNGLPAFIREVVPGQTDRTTALAMLDRIQQGNAPDDLTAIRQRFETALSAANEDIRIYFQNRQFKDRRARAVVSPLEHAGNYADIDAERTARAARRILSLSKTYYEIICS